MTSVVRAGQRLKHATCPAERADIARLRELHVEMDNAVAAAYGWNDPSTGSGQALKLGHDFHETAQGVRFTISEAARRAVLARLLQPNHERYEEEIRMGLHDKKKAKKAERAERGDKRNAGTRGRGRKKVVKESAAA